MSENILEPTSVGPISPKEAQERHLGSEIPGEVYAVFNRILSERFAHSITIKQKEVVQKVIDEMRIGEQDVTAQYIFDHHWLDIGPAYEKLGWLVMYYKPGYNESWEAYWIFSVSES